jgi:acid phosphatase family membrane protein YuiD
MLWVKARLAAADAQVYWMSAKVPNDEFLLYAFSGQPKMHTAVAETLARARSCPELQVRLEDGYLLTYPVWVRGRVDDSQVVTRAGELRWQDCLDAVARLADHQLDLRRCAWRLHVFAPVLGVPGAEPATVAVLQIGHAVGDGIRSSALAAALFGRSAPIPACAFVGRGRRIRRAIDASRMHRRLERDTVAGLVPAPAPARPALSTNSRPDEARMARTLTRRRRQMRGPTVTVAALAAVSAALSGYLRARGEDASRLGAEVPMAKTGMRLANNHFGNVGVGLHPNVDATQRARSIAAELAERRRRAGHPAFHTGDLAMGAVPAPLLRWGVEQFDFDARSTQVIGNTVVSSVNRGQADLRFGGLPVVLSAGYPALSPMMGLTHGVHGIGDTIAISVHAAASAMADIDDYVERLDAALGSYR